MRKCRHVLTIAYFKGMGLKMHLNEFKDASSFLPMVLQGGRSIEEEPRKVR